MQKISGDELVLADDNTGHLLTKRLTYADVVRTLSLIA